MLDHLSQTVLAWGYAICITDPLLVNTFQHMMHGFGVELNDLFNENKVKHD